VAPTTSDTHIPSLTHLRDFARARAAGRRTHVAQDKAQVNAPANDRFFGFAYERFLSSTIAYVGAGRRSDALERAHETASPRMAASYRAAAKGMDTILEELDAVSARRRQRNVVVVDPESGDALVSLRLHLLLESSRGRAVAAHLYFSDRALAPAELRVMETAVALAVRQATSAFSPAIAVVRNGSLAAVGAEALSTERVEALRAVSDEYHDAWDAEG
jgi:hypothetical protein